MLRANFQDEVDFDDTLSLAQLVNDLLRNVSSRGRQTPLVFVDAVELPDAYRPAGRYAIDGDEVTIQAHMFRGKERVARFKVVGSKSDLDGLANKVVAEAQREVLAKCESVDHEEGEQLEAEFRAIIELLDEYPVVRRTVLAALDDMEATNNEARGDDVEWMNVRDVMGRRIRKALAEVL